MSKRPFTFDDAQRGITGTPRKITNADIIRFNKILILFNKSKLSSVKVDHNVKCSQ